MKKIFALVILTLTLGTTTIYAERKESSANNLNSAAAVQQGSITGQVFDYQSYAPVFAAIITVNGNNITKKFSSNDNGIFEIAGLPMGEYTVEVSFPGCKKTQTKVVVAGTLTDMGVIEIK